MFSHVQKWNQTPDRVDNMQIFVLHASNMCVMLSGDRNQSLKFMQCETLGDRDPWQSAECSATSQQKTLNVQSCQCLEIVFGEGSELEESSSEEGQDTEPENSDSD